MKPCKKIFSIFTFLALLPSPLYAVTTDVLLPPNTSKETQDTQESPKLLNLKEEPDPLEHSTGTGQQPLMTPLPPDELFHTKTHVIKVPNKPLNPTPAQGTKALTITLPSSLWTNINMLAVQRKLNIAPSETTQHCSINTRGMVMASQKTYPFDLHKSNSTTIMYDGEIKMIMITPKAYCLTDTLPQNAGTILQVENKYEVSLSSIICTPPINQKVSSISVSFGKYDIGNCTYQ